MAFTDRYGAIRLLRPPTYIPTDDELARAEATLGTRLPPSYRAFAKKFGYGRFARLYLIYVPMPGEDSLLVRHDVLRNTIEIGVDEDIVDYKPDGSAELLKRLIPFGVSESGDIVAWDPAIRSTEGEYAIFMIGPRNAGVARSASDLYDFAEKCLTHAERGRLPRRTGVVEPVFEPIDPHDG